MSGRDDFNTLAPEFAVTVNGSELPHAAAADLIRLSVQDDVDAPGMLAITLAAWDTVTMKPKWIDDDLFLPGRSIEVQFGYRDQSATVFSGEITGLEPDFAERQAPTVTVRGHDLRHRLMRARKTRSYTQMKDSDIAGQIASGAGLSPETSDSGPTLPYVLQHNQTDLEFLSQRARRIEFELAVQGRKLIFRPRKLDGAAALTLHREIEMLSFQARLSTLGQVTECEVRGWDPQAKKEIVGHAAVGDESPLLGSNSGPSATRKAFSSLATARVDMPVQSADEAQGIARRAFAEMALRYVKAEGLCIGEPRLRAGIVVCLEGLGKRFGGNYYVTAVEHHYTPHKGFRTGFSARRNAT